MIEPSLADRANAILRKLALISEAPVASQGSGARRAKHQSTEPRGVSLHALDARPRGAAPSKDDGLHDFYRYHFERARDDRRMRVLCFLAERDYAAHTHRQPQLPTPRESIQERDDRLAENYEGCHSVEAAMLEDCSESLMQKARRRRGRDATWGRPLEQEQAA